MKPVYQHNCSACVFLGRVSYNDPWSGDDKDADLYFCGESEPDTGGTLLARGSDTVSDYASTPRSILERRVNYPLSTMRPALLMALMLLRNREAVAAHQEAEGPCPGCGTTMIYEDETIAGQRCQKCQPCEDKS